MRFHSRLAAEHMPEGILGAEGGKFIYRLILDSWSNGDFRVIFAKKTSVSVFDGDLRRIFHTPQYLATMRPAMCLGNLYSIKCRSFLNLSP